MMSSTRFSVVLFALAACAPLEGEQAPRDEFGTTGQELFASTYASMNVRGTCNHWGLTAMTLEGDHLWLGEATFGASANQRFKFDVRGDWSMNFGDNEPDQTADRSGRDIAVESGKTFRIHFNDESRFFYVEEKTFSANVTLRLPGGLATSALVGAQTKLIRDGQNYGWNGIYDGVVPLCCLTKGSSYRLTLEFFAGMKRYGGEVAWSVDGRTDPIALVMNVTELSMDAFGAVEVTAFADRFENGRLASGVWSGMDIFYGDWHGGDRRGTTDNNGKLTLILPAGNAELGAMIMTSSHSVASATSRVTVVARGRVSHEIHLAPVTVVIRAHADVGFGNAVYLSGATSYLGDWQKAVRMTWDPMQHQWSYVQNLPMGVPYKLLVGPYAVGESAAVAQLKWEQGDNRIVTPPNGSYQSDLEAWPRF